MELTGYRRFPQLGIQGTSEGRNSGGEWSGVVGGCIARGVNGYVGRTFQLGAKGDTCFIHVRREAQSNWEKSEGVRRRDHSSQIHHLSSFMQASQIHHFRASIPHPPSQIIHLRLSFRSNNCCEVGCDLSRELKRPPPTREIPVELLKDPLNNPLNNLIRSMGDQNH